jgi:butyryl-CoA dehydrogenase
MTEKPTEAEWLVRASTVGDTVLARYAEELDREPRYPEESVAAILGAGFARILVAPEYGGTGDGVVTACRVIERLAESCSSTPLVLTSTWTTGLPLYLGASEALREQWLPPLADGSKRACFAVTEENAGNDIRAMRTSVRADGTAHVLVNGSKWFAGNAAGADVFLVLGQVSTGDEGGEEPAIVLVERSAEGIEVLAPIEKLGLRGTLHSPVTFTNTRVPADHVLARGSDALRILLRTIDMARPLTAALCLGIARAALSDAVGYARVRNTFGRPIGSRQLVQELLAEAAVDLETGTTLTYDVARSIDQDFGSFLKPKRIETTGVRASIAKLYTSQMVSRVATRALQVHGGQGYVRGNRVERLFRDARAAEIFEGTTEIQKLVIGRALVSGDYFPVSDPLHSEQSGARPGATH